MIQHIMLWNYKEGVAAEVKAKLEAELAGLPRKVPALRSVQWGPVIGGRNQSFSHCFVMLFDNKSDLAEYTVHPDHVHFAGPFREVCAVQVVADFQVWQ